MALSQQDLFVNLLLPSKDGFYVDIGAGNGEGEPCASNNAWLEELGWSGILLEIRSDYAQQARVFRPRSHIVQADAFTIDYKELFIQLNCPKVIDYLSIDIDPIGSIQAPCVDVLSKFPFEDFDFKILTIEHDLYNPHGEYQKIALSSFMKNKPYKMIVENVGLSFAGKKYLEDWYINPKYYNDFQIKDIENLFYKEKNPNDIIMDLASRRK